MGGSFSSHRTSGPRRRLAIAGTFRDRLSGLDLSGFTNVFAEGGVVETGELVPAADLLTQLGTVPGLAKVLDRLGYGDAAGRGQVAAAAESRRQSSTVFSRPSGRKSGEPWSC